MSANDLKVLIVDDESLIRRALQTTLSTFGFEVINAGRGEEALALIRLTHFRAVLLDINMPGMSGIETCSQIRHIDPHVSILMLTVRDSGEDKVEALDAGADDYVTKPFHVGELAARLRAAVRRSLSNVDEKDVAIRIGEIECDLQKELSPKRDSFCSLHPKSLTSCTISCLTRGYQSAMYSYLPLSGERNTAMS